MSSWEIGIFFIALVIVSGGVAEYTDPIDDPEPSCSEILIYVVAGLYIVAFVLKAVL